MAGTVVTGPKHADGPERSGGGRHFVQTCTQNGSSEHEFVIGATLIRASLVVDLAATGICRVGHGAVQIGAATLGYPFFRLALALNPRHYDALRFSAWCLREKGDLNGAIDRYLELVEVAPWFVDGRVELGFALSRLGRYSEALDQFDQALKHSPEDWGARWGLAAMLMHLNHPAEAIPVCEGLLRDDPANLDAWGFLARNHLDVGQWNDALIAYETAQALGSEPHIAVEHANLLLAEFNRPAMAEAVLRAALVSHPGHRMVRDQLAFTLVEQQRYPDAERLLQDILREDPLDRQARFTLALLLAESARTSEASAVAETLVSDTPDDPQMRYMLGWVALKEERWADALAAFEHGLRVEPGRAELVAGRATALKRLGRQSEAQALVTTIVERDPSYFDRHVEWDEFAAS